MPRFPKKEAEISALAESLWRGLFDHAALYPTPPVHPVLLRTRMYFYRNRRDQNLTAHATAEAAIAAKDDALATLVEALKTNILYAENTAKGDDDKLKLIGWAGRKASSALTVPGQTRLLEAPKQGAGWLFLDWKPPAEGGKPAAYTIERRERPAESGAVDDRWKSVATAILTEATLVEQPEKQQLEYRVIAVNKAGEGTPSNTVMVVL